MCVPVKEGLLMLMQKAVYLMPVIHTIQGAWCSDVLLHCMSKLTERTEQGWVVANDDAQICFNCKI